MIMTREWPADTYTSNPYRNKKASGIYLGERMKKKMGMN